MIFRWIQKMRFLRAYVTAIRTPERTEEIFKAISGPNVVTQKTLEPVFAALAKSEKCKEVLASQYSRKWDLDNLMEMPDQSFGHVYAKHMRQNKLKPDFYPIIGGVTPAVYIQNRSRETHDIWHVLTGFDTSIPGEIGLQAFVYAQIRGRVSMIILSILLLHCIFIQPQLLPAAVGAIAKGWDLGLRSEPLFGEKFEENWFLPIEEYRRSLRLLDT
jgi:ubiquinone biosynthesis protein COQ4